MGWGNKGKGKDDDPGKGRGRRPGESNEELIKRLERQRAEGRQQCGACKGRGVVVKPKSAMNRRGEGGTVPSVEECKDCGGLGSLPGRTR